MKNISIPNKISVVVENSIVAAISPAKTELDERDARGCGVHLKQF